MRTERPNRGCVAVLAGAMTLGVLASGCCKKPTGESTEGLPEAGAAPSPVGEATRAPKEDPGPAVTVPAGTLVAGTPCQRVPRITNEELEGVSLHMSEFTIDVHPYPNDPAQPPRTGVSRDQAEALCRARGRRLCSELEWERACKGPSNHAYPYGDTFLASKCTGSTTLLRAAGQYDACASAFGAKALYGAVWEWTSSEWGRGAPGGLAAVRGGGHTNLAVRTRCANGQSRSPGESAADLGFRCCGGPANPAAVNLPLDKREPIVADGAVDPSLASRLMGALPADMRTVQGFTPGIDRIWRWHPRDNEEMIIARYRATRDGGRGAFYHPVVFHLCGNSTVRSAKLRGPVARMLDPTVGSDPQRVTIQVETEADKGEVVLTYGYGNVAAKQPDWVKQGNSIDVGGGPRIPGVRIRLPAMKKN